MSYVEELQKAKRDAPGAVKKTVTGEDRQVEPEAPRKSPMEGRFYTNETIKRFQESREGGGQPSITSPYTKYGSMKKKPE